MRHTGALGKREAIVQTDVKDGIWIWVRLCGSGIKHVKYGRSTEGERTKRSPARWV